MNVREIRAMTGLSQRKFGKKYNIPYRTIEDWECDRRTPPAYVVKLLERVVKMDYEVEHDKGTDEA